MIAVFIVQVYFVFGIAFIICEIGQRVSDSFDQIFDTIDQFEWYLFPIKIQRLLPTLLIIAEQPVEIAVIGSTSPNRNTLKKVCSRFCCKLSD